MTSAIDVTVPIYGNPTTKSVRDNFVAAHDEIGALQTDVSTRVKKSGDTMQGFLELYRDPEIDMQAATKRYVDSKSGGASLTVADTPPSIANGKMWFDSIGTQLYIGYDDGNTKQWVIATNPNVQQSSVALQPTYNNAGRNLLHNSQFNIQQRGAGAFTAATNITADRWRVAKDGADSNPSTSIVAINAANIAAIGDESARYNINVSVTGSATAASDTWFGQAIEDVRRLAGKTVTLSFWCWSNGTRKVGFGPWQSFGTGGSPSAYVQVPGVAVTVGTTPTRYSITLTMPSIAGKTIGTNNDSVTVIALWLSASTDQNTASGGVGVQTAPFNFWGMQCEIGSVATPLEKIDIGDDLNRCQRFYQAASFNLSGGAPSGGAGWTNVYPLPVVMRATPTIVTSATTATNIGSQSVTPMGSWGLQVYCVPTATGGFVWLGNYTASADL